MGLIFPRLTPEQLDQLCLHDWPGNVRELEHLMERLLVRLKGSSFKFDDILSSELEHIHRLDKVLATGVTATPSCDASGRFVCPLAANAASAAGLPAAADENLNGPVALRNLLRSSPWPSLKALTESYIDDALRYTGGRIGGDDGAAALLNVHPNTLRVRRQKKKNTG